jgi:hypothetical protein
LGIPWVAAFLSTKIFLKKFLTFDCLNLSGASPSTVLSWGRFYEAVTDKNRLFQFKLVIVTSNGNKIFESKNIAHYSHIHLHIAAVFSAGKCVLNWRMKIRPKFEYENVFKL